MFPNVENFITIYPNTMSEAYQLGYYKAILEKSPENSTAVLSEIGKIFNKENITLDQID